jgi:hypothetical protein
MQHYISADHGKLAKTCKKPEKITKKITNAGKKVAWPFNLAISLD